MKQTEQRRVPHSNGWVLPLVLGSIAGAFSSIIFLSWLGDLTPNGVSYNDLAAVLLTAVGVIVTVLGVIFAIAAFWGFTELKKSAVTAAEKAAIAEVEEQIENGPIREYLSRAVSAEIDSPETDERIRSRVDEVLLGNPAKDNELDEEEAEGDESPPTHDVGPQEGEN